jgi:hypothetical protein
MRTPSLCACLRVAAGALTAVWAVPLLAQDLPVAIFHEYHAANQIGSKGVHHRDTAYLTGTRGVSAVANGFQALAYGYGAASGVTTNYSHSLDDTDNFVMELQVPPRDGYTYRWATVGAQAWKGDAQASAWEGGSARIDLSAILSFSSDLRLSGDATVSAADESGLSFTWNQRNGLGAAYAVTRATSYESDSCTGRGSSSGSGDGPNVRIDVLSAAHAGVSLRTPIGAGFACVEGKTEILGIAKLRVTEKWSPARSVGGGASEDVLTPGAGPAEPGTRKRVLTAKRTPSAIILGPGVKFSPEPPEHPKPPGEQR